MGGIGLVIGLASAPEDPETLMKLHREVWTVIDSRIASLAKRKASRDILTWYLHEESSDGYADDDWFATREALYYTFGDAAGLCYREMYVSLHWAELALLDQWAAASAIAANYGAALVPPERAISAMTVANGQFATSVFPGDSSPALDAILTGRAEHVFFAYQSKLAWARALDNGEHSGGDPLDADQSIGLPDNEELPLRRVRAADRDRVAELIQAGRCACELCQKLRAERGLPLAPEPDKAAPRPKTPRLTEPQDTAAPRHSLVTAPVLSLAEAKALRSDPAGVVALNLPALGRRKPPASFIATLPRYPIRALGLRGHGMRGVLPEILALRDLEVLSLRGANMHQPLHEGLAGLTRLRGLDLDGRNYFAKLLSPALFTLSGLEVLDYSGWRRELPEGLWALRSLRHLDLTTIWTVPRDVAGLPLESLVLHGEASYDASLLTDLPLRYLEWVGSSGAIPTSPTLTDVTLGQSDSEVPETLRNVPALRGLHTGRYLQSLPTWLPIDLPHLEALHLCTDALGHDVDSFRAIERLANLRVLVLRAGFEATGIDLDLSGLTNLETLVVSGGRIASRAGLPRGIGSLPRLRTFIHETAMDDSAARDLREAVPGAAWGANTIWGWQPRSFYRARLPRGSIEWYLARFAEDAWVDLAP